MKILEIQLFTHLLEAQKQFYTETLGMPLLTDKAAFFTVRAGHTVIKFSRAEKGETPFYHFAFNIPENSIPTARKWLAERVTLLRQDGKEVFHFAEWNADALYFEDPSGNIVEAIARHSLRNASSASFSTKSLLGVSEIGVPVEEGGVKLFSTHVQQELRLRLWRGDERQLAAVGDEEGLFIIVPVGRPWFPTSKPAQYFQPIVDIDPR